MYFVRKTRGNPDDDLIKEKFKKGIVELSFQILLYCRKYRFKLNQIDFELCYIIYSTIIMVTMLLSQKHLASFANLPIGSCKDLYGRQASL